MIDLLEGVEKNLRSPNPGPLIDYLKTIRPASTNCKNAKSRNDYEAKLEMIIQNEPYFKEAAEHYLTPLVESTLGETTRILREAIVVLRTYKDRRPATHLTEQLCATKQYEQQSVITKQE